VPTRIRRLWPRRRRQVTWPPRLGSVSSCGFRRPRFPLLSPWSSTAVIFRVLKRRLGHDEHLFLLVAGFASERPTPSPSSSSSRRRGRRAAHSHPRQVILVQHLLLGSLYRAGSAGWLGMPLGIWRRLSAPKVTSSDVEDQAAGAQAIRPQKRIPSARRFLTNHYRHSPCRHSLMTFEIRWRQIRLQPAWPSGGRRRGIRGPGLSLQPFC